MPPGWATAKLDKVKRPGLNWHVREQDGPVEVFPRDGAKATLT